MKEKSIQVFDIMTREWQRLCLRGGRCEPFKLYWKACHEDEELKLFDVNSEYPAAQIMGYAPYGAVTVDKEYDEPTPILAVCREIYREHKFNLIECLMDRTGASGMGLIECTIESSFHYIPILPLKVKRGNYSKNMFMIRNGVWHGWTTILGEAINHSQVVVTHIRRIQFWKCTSNSIFKSFLSPLYAAKVEATGWNNIFKGREYTESDKKEFIDESRKRGIIVDEKKVEENAGRRYTSKIANNCGWGYMCSKPHATDILYFDNFDKDEVMNMSDILSSLETDRDCRRLVGLPVGVGRYTRMKLTKQPRDMKRSEVNANIAYQTGGCAPAWGLQLVSRNLLTLHPEQAVYMDTDSIFFIYDKRKTRTHRLIKTGPYLGDFVDEYPEWRIIEYVCLGPKTYYIKMVHRKSGKVEVKGRFKGLPFMSSSFSMLDNNENLASLGMEEMKKILFDSLKSKGKDDVCLKFMYTNYFKRGNDFKITESQEKKTLRFTFDKRKVNIPDSLDNVNEINTAPLVEGEILWTPDEISDWWIRTCIQVTNKV